MGHESSTVSAGHIFTECGVFLSRPLQFLSIAEHSGARSQNVSFFAFVVMSSYSKTSLVQNRLKRMRLTHEINSLT